MLIAGVEDVEGAEQINIDHRLEGIGAHSQRWRKEIARCTGQHDVDLAKSVAAMCIGLGDLGIIAHIAGHADSIAGNGCGGGGDLFLAAADHHDFGSRLGIALRDPQVDPR